VLINIIYKVLYDFSFNAAYKKLQSTEIDLHTVFDLYNDLENYLVHIRNDFDVSGNKAVEITGCSNYTNDSKRKKEKNMFNLIILKYI